MGTGHIRQRGTGHRPSLEVRVYAGVDPDTGRKRWVTETVRWQGGTKKTWDAAERVKRRILDETDRGAHSGPDATLAKLIDRWWALASPDWSPTTRAAYRSYINHRVLPDLGAVKLRDLRPAAIDAFYSRLRAAGLTAGSRHKVHVILRRALDQAVLWGWLVANPVDHATAPKVARREIQPPSDTEVELLVALAADTNPDLATWLLLDARTGARRGELCGLRWIDIDLDAGEATFARVAVHGDHGIEIRDRTKTGTPRRIALGEATAAVLREHRRRCAERALACGVGLDDMGFVFSPTPDASRPYRPDSITQAFGRLRARAGLSHVRLHDLRHYVVTRLLGEGVDVRTVAGRVGHANASTTLNIYAHFIPAADRAAAEVLERRHSS